MRCRPSFSWIPGFFLGAWGLLPAPAVGADDSLHVRLTTCAETVRRLRDANQDSAALALGARCLPAAVPPGAESAAARLAYENGLCERRLGRYLTGLETTRRGLAWAERGRDTVYIERCRYLLAVLHADRGDHAQAIAQCQANLQWYHALPTGRLLGGNYLLLAAVYERLRNDPTANRYRAAYLRLALRSPDPEQRLIAYSLQATQLGKRRLYRQAALYQQKAIALAQRMKTGNDQDYLISLLVEQAELQRLGGDPIAALTSLAQASAYLRRYDTPVLRALIQNGRAAALLALKRPDDATRAGEQALRYARRSHRPDVLLQVLSVRQRLQERTGAYPAALQTAREAYALADSLATVAKVEAIAEVETRYGLARKEADLLALRRETMIQQLRLQAHQRELRQARQQHLWLFIGLGAVVVVVLVVGFLWERTRHLYRQAEQQRQTLEEQAAELHAANTTKDRLFSIIGHDLRSSAGQLHQSLARVSTGENPALREAERRAYALNQQLNNLLYWALTQQDGLSVHRRSERLDELVAEALDEFGPSLADKSLGLINQVGPEELVTDERLVSLVLRNLLHNAVKFTPKGGRITVSSRRTDGAVFLSIRDTGPGLDATRASRPRAESGTGLGLSVSKELMRACGGSLRLRPAEPHGTEALLEFPE
jgi:signal transduction histidine kinase